MTVKGLANYFEDKMLPGEPVKLHPATFVQSEFEILHYNSGHKAYHSCSLRLIEFKE
jgi:hypothetical protein